MNYGKFVKPVGKVAGVRPFVIGPGFATFPAAGATKASGFQKIIPTTRVFTSPFGKGFGKPFGKFYGI
ncbi:MAG: hypothetical protein K0R39_1332 [Symbiobacteriaceae bacterium]|jgi:hypothetical protein|nr:hypothetical protein [Symbiobacteriaceae bacterium]